MIEKRGDNKLDFAFLKENMMGPNAVMIMEEMTQTLKLKKGMRVLDWAAGGA